MTVTINICGIKRLQRGVQLMMIDGDWMTDIYASFICSLDMLESSFFIEDPRLPLWCSITHTTEDDTRYLQT
jgi:hypothetical protein